MGGAGAFRDDIGRLADDGDDQKEYRLISIGAFSLALEPWMGAGFVLAALVPPQKRG